MTHPEYYEEMGIKPPKGVILYGAPGTGKGWDYVHYCIQWDPPMWTLLGPHCVHHVVRNIEVFVFRRLLAVHTHAVDHYEG